MNRPETLLKWLCSFALTIWQRQTRAAWATSPEARGAGGGGPLVPEKPASCWARCEPGRHNAAVVGLISSCGLLVWL